MMSGECPIVVTRTFTVFDPCGNSTSCEQTITLDDTIDPIIACPADIEVEGCDESQITNGSLTALAYSETPIVITELEFTNEGGSASDDCTIDSIEYVDVMSGACPIIVTRTFTVFDPCGNSASCEQTITIDDTIDPIIACPADIEVAVSYTHLTLPTTPYV